MQASGEPLWYSERQVQEDSTSEASATEPAMGIVPIGWNAVVLAQHQAEKSKSCLPTVRLAALIQRLIRVL